MKASASDRWYYDVLLLSENNYLIGVDEAGRGAFAGPVVAAAVLINKEFYKSAVYQVESMEFNDSKQIKPLKRMELFNKLLNWKLENVLDYEVGVSSAVEVDTKNVLEATKLAMAQAIQLLMKKHNLRFRYNELFIDYLIVEGEGDSQLIIDGRGLKGFPYPHEGVIEGDSKSLAIAMASIIAKCTRDNLMKDLHKRYPLYGFDQHKGYGTMMHREAIQNYGLIDEHRSTFIKKPNLCN